MANDKKKWLQFPDGAKDLHCPQVLPALTVDEVKAINEKRAITINPTHDKLVFSTAREKNGDIMGGCEITAEQAKLIEMHLPPRAEILDKKPK